MTLIGTKEGDTGFGSLREILEEIEPVAEFEQNHGGEEYAEIVVNSLCGAQSVEAAEHQEFSWGDRYVEARLSFNGASLDSFSKDAAARTASTRSRYLSRPVAGEWLHYKATDTAELR